VRCGRQGAAPRFSSTNCAEFDRDRKHIVSASFGECITDLGGVSAPVFDVGRRLVGALTVSAPQRVLSRSSSLMQWRFPARSTANWRG
jgi:DNA-binding IclR family transcriptional regulator